MGSIFVTITRSLTVIFCAMTDEFEKANKSIKRCQITSEISSDEASDDLVIKQRKRKAPRRLSYESDESETDKRPLHIELIDTDKRCPY